MMHKRESQVGLTWRQARQLAFQIGDTLARDTPTIAVWFVFLDEASRINSNNDGAVGSNIIVMDAGERMIRQPHNVSLEPVAGEPAPCRQSVVHVGLLPLDVVVPGDKDRSGTLICESVLKTEYERGDCPEFLRGGSVREIPGDSDEHRRRGLPWRAREH